MEAPPIQFLTPSTPAEWDATRLIFREYARSLGVDLCFQNFEAELDGLPGDYAEPRGALLLALVNGQIAGCCAMRPLDNVDYPNASEMKRLYVRKAFRGSGLGRQLAEAILDAARRANAIWKKLLAEYQQPTMDVAVEEELLAYVAKRKLEIPG